MMMTDPISDMLTRIRNGLMARQERVDIPASKIKVSIARILKEEGYIRNYKVFKDNKQGILRVLLKYNSNNEPVIKGLKRESKPSRRHYVRQDKIPRILSGLGVSVLSTSKGVLTGREARQQNVGGELIFSVW
ncbi:MAG: 30S ribosomal protein S8 [Deltaproteobacteria bacterium]|nr:30S ribosomal protein S8 [Deltaproteobacteria bacterium]MBW2051736.1 30S ribosomal protein S8 [Deltaproteobacteria bacterium]MBW2140275.1 30S ribosomal protein S8 [Deltaproteobacteria bacterium]MBW2322118.1 30S ribosomal protein S8 [Deltaproteobacteria bacterium]